MSARDTIFALATPPGRSAVAILRLSGPAIRDTLAHLGVTPLPAPRLLSRRLLRHPDDGTPLDDAMAVWFPAPRSYTGEDMAELHTHGSPAVVRTLLRLLASFPGCRQAEPGEFSRRAFDHGKLDLTQVEGIAETIAAETELQLRQALAQVRGELSAFYDDVRARLLRALALVTACLDFVEEDIPESVLHEADAHLRAAHASIKTFIAQSATARKIHEGCEVVLFGPPNAGKSLLLNRLAQEDVAIVSPVPGTTRDTLSVHLEIGGHSVRLTDTAGLRESDDLIEQMGISRAEAKLARADVKILVLDACESPIVPPHFLPYLDDTTLTILNKCDLLPSSPPPAHRTLALSALTGDGIDALLSAIATDLRTHFPEHASQSATSLRHLAHLEVCHAALERALAPSLSLELVAEEILAAANALGAITGKIANEEILGEIFSSFCIGK